MTLLGTIQRLNRFFFCIRSVEWDGGDGNGVADEEILDQSVYFTIPHWLL